MEIEVVDRGAEDVEGVEERGACVEDFDLEAAGCVWVAGRAREGGETDDDC